MPKKRHGNSKAARRAIRNSQPKTKATPEVTWCRNKFQCFVCFDQDISLLEYEMVQHQELNISMCDSCAKQHLNDDGEWHESKYWFEFDQNGKCLYCTICGEGGTLMACDKEDCNKSYCLDCLGKWLGKETLDEFVEDESKAFACFCCQDKTDEKSDEEKSGDDDDSKKIYRNYNKFKKASRSYNKQKDKIDHTDLELKLEKSLKSTGWTKQFICYCCFSVCDFTKKTIPGCHPKLDIAMCQDCLDFLNFSGGHDPLDFCYLSGEDGEVIPCDNKECGKSFSKHILANWLGYEKSCQVIEDDTCEFTCFFCDPAVGRCQKFLDQTKNVLSAFTTDSVAVDDDFVLPKAVNLKRNSPRSNSSAKATKRRKLAETKDRRRSSRHSNSKTGRRSRSSRHEPEPSDSEEEPEKRVTRERNNNTEVKYIMSSDEGETDSDGHVDPKSKEEKEEITDDLARDYFRKKIERSQKGFKETAMFQRLMSLIDEE